MAAKMFNVDKALPFHHHSQIIFKAYSKAFINWLVFDQLKNTYIKAYLTTFTCCL